MLVCLFQMSSACVWLKLTPIPIALPYPRKMYSWSHLSQEASLFGKVGPVLSLQTCGAITSQEERWKGIWEGNKFPAQGPQVDGGNFSFLSNSEILTGITSQDSKCFLSCHNPLKFFFSPFPCDSVSVSHSLSAGFGAPPPPCKSHPGTRKEA